MKHMNKPRYLCKIIGKLMGLIVAPFAFCAVICGILLLIANATVGDIVGYGSVLLMNPVPDDSVSEQLESSLLKENIVSDEEYVDISEVEFPTYEKVYGEISVPDADILCPLVFGDTETAMSKGAGQYIGSSIIGYGGTTMICAHVTRQFKNLHKVKPGNLVQIRTTYGVYTYEVKYVGVHSATDDSIYDLSREDENIVMYTCYYQQTALGSVKKRFFVCADYVSGPMIVDRGGQS